MQRNTTASDLSQTVAEAVQGNVGAFEELVSQHYGLVFTVVLGYVKSIEQAEEITQDAFIKAYRSLPALRDKATFPSWLVQIGRNLALDSLRAGAAQKRRLGSGGALSPALRDSRPDPREMAHRNEAHRQVMQALADVPHDAREMMLLHFMEDLSKSEIARVFGVHPATVGRTIDKWLSQVRNQSNVRQHALDLRPSTAVITGITSAIAVLATSQESTASSELLDKGVSQLRVTTSRLSAVTRSFTPFSIITVFMVTGVLLTTVYALRKQSSQTLNRIEARKTAALKPSSQPTIVNIADEKMVRQEPDTNPSSAEKLQSTASPNETKAAPLFTISGHITDEREMVVSNTRVWCHVHNDSGDYDFEGVVQGDGSYAVDCLVRGDTFVVVDATGSHLGMVLPIMTSEMLENDLIFQNPDNFSSKDIRLISAGFSTISGKVVVEDTGEPLSGMWVVAVRARGLRDGVEASSGTVTFEMTSIANATTNSRGEFTISKLPAGRYILRAVGYPFWHVVSGFEFYGRFPLSEGETTSGLVLAMRPGRTLQGRIIDSETSQGLGGVRIGTGWNYPFVPTGFKGNYKRSNLSWRAENEWIRIDNAVESDSRGHYRLLGLPWSICRVPTLRLDAYLPGSGSDGTTEASPNMFLKSSQPPPNESGEEMWTYRNAPPKLQVDFTMVPRKGTGPPSNQ